MEAILMEQLLTGILKCGTDDLRAIEHCSYDVGDLLDRIEETDMQLDINTLIWAMFEAAFEDVQLSINERIDNLKIELEAGQFEGEEDLKLEIEDIVWNASMDIRNDCQIHVNYLDSSVTLVSNTERYQGVFQQDLDMFEELTGYEILA